MQFKRLLQIFSLPHLLSLCGTALIALVLCSCSTPQLAVNISDESFYTLEGANGVVITHLFSSEVSSISLSAWNEISEGMTCMSAQAIADFKSELEKLCSEAPCNQQDVATVKSAFARIQHASPH